MLTFFRKVALIFLIPIALFLVLYLLLLIYIGTKVSSDNKVVSDTILVLGARSYKDGRYNPCLQSRVEHGVELYKQGYAKTLLFSGGTDREDNKNEAETMEEIALSLGASSSAILLEKKSSSTYENLLFSKQILDNTNNKSIIIITEPFHAPRAALVAKKLGLNYTLSPAANSPCWIKWKYLSRYFLREPLGILKYKFGNKL